MHINYRLYTCICICTFEYRVHSNTDSNKLGTLIMMGFVSIRHTCLKASEHDTDSERSFLLMATPLSALPMAVSSLYAGMCLALTSESISSSERCKHPSWKK